MKKYQKKVAEEYIQLLHKAHDVVKNAMEYKDTSGVLDLLEQCQEAAITLGNLIEESEGEGFVTVGLLEEYCERVYQIYALITQNQVLNPNKVFENLKKLLIQIENSLHMDIKVRREVVFLPYKASMWDSLESVWMAADKDPDCDAYVIPIPYYDRNPDGSFGTMHDERDQYPEYVPVMRYEEYDFNKRHPEVIFIHNPYDGYNYVTSVHPFFYSSNLKQFTDLLVYIPYFSMSGVMGEGQKSCPVYYNADYIVIQAEKYREFYDPAIPEEKLVALGSPKFDRVIRMCENPPEPPEEWKAKFAGKKVYFYNTSINGLLQNTEALLKKMQYVFQCFEGRKDACLLWRPHPLLKSTFQSMRPAYLLVYEALEKYFLTNDIGIYDDTPDITKTIAFCDAYVGDSASSVTSLFGLAGKPLFILNNNIHRRPNKDDWRGHIIRGMPVYGSEAWIITAGNRLYHAVNGTHYYNYCCTLSEYAADVYYSQVFDFRGKSYVCPRNAQDILVLENGEIIRRVKLKKHIEQNGAFHSSIQCGQYLFLIPFRYPALVRYDMLRDRVDYFEEHLEIFNVKENGIWKIGGYDAQGDCLYIASPVNDKVLVINVESGRQQVLATGIVDSGGCLSMNFDGNDFWMMPYLGYTVTRWNPVTGEARGYNVYLDGMESVCEERPFSRPAFFRGQVFLSPFSGNQYVRLEKESGAVTTWEPSFEKASGKELSKGYFPADLKSCFTNEVEGSKGREWKLFSMPDRRYYTVDLETGESKEIPLEFDLEELKDHEQGFQAYSQWLQYACKENAFHSLEDFLDGRITQNGFDSERQIRAFGQIAANYDGTCGEAVYHFVCSKE